MRKGVLLAGALAAMLAGSAWAEDDVRSDAMATFTARYDELAAGIEARDAAAVAKVVTPDYALTDIRGEVHDAQGLMTMGQRITQTATNRKRTREVLAAKVTGESAAVKVKVDTAMTRADPDGSVHQMELIVVSDDAWIRSDGAWRLKASVQNDLTVRRDGEDVFHQGN